MSDELLKDAWLLVFANKSDMRNAFNTTEICERLSQGSSINPGVAEGILKV